VTIDLDKIKEFTSLPDKILINGKTAWFCYIQMPHNMYALGYYYKAGENGTMAGYTIKRECKNGVVLFDLIVDFEVLMKGLLE